MGTAAFTGYAFTEIQRFALYDTKTGRAVNGREWESERMANDFRDRLPFKIQDRLIVLPVRLYELHEFKDGTDLDRDY